MMLTKEEYDKKQAAVLRWHLEASIWSAGADAVERLGLEGEELFNFMRGIAKRAADGIDPLGEFRNRLRDPDILNNADPIMRELKLRRLADDARDRYLCIMVEQREMAADLGPYPITH